VLFNKDEKARPIGVIAEAKGDNLLTIAAFKELIAFDNIIHNIELYSETDFDEGAKEELRSTEGRKVKFIDICDVQTFTSANGATTDKCVSRGQPIDFIYDLTKSNKYDMSGYTQQSLLTRINSGRNNQIDETFRLNTFLAEVNPENYSQDRSGAVSPFVTSAKAAAFGYFIKNGRNEDINEGFYRVFEQDLIDAVDKFQETAEYVNFSLFTTTGLRKAFSDDIQADLALVQVAIMLVAFYTIIVLGTCSGMHCRLIVSLMGLLSVGLAYASGFGFCYYLGG